jgi:hypothetical protein
MYTFKNYKILNLYLMKTNFGLEVIGHEEQPRTEKKSLDTYSPNKSRLQSIKEEERIDRDRDSEDARELVELENIPEEERNEEQQARYKELRGSDSVRVQLKLARMQMEQINNEIELVKEA